MNKILVFALLMAATSVHAEEVACTSEIKQGILQLHILNQSSMAISVSREAAFVDDQKQIPNLQVLTKSDQRVPLKRGTMLRTPAPPRKKKVENEIVLNPGERLESAFVDLHRWWQIPEEGELSIVYLLKIKQNLQTVWVFCR